MRIKKCTTKSRLENRLELAAVLGCLFEYNEDEL
jgi:hypothetical protein